MDVRIKIEPDLAVDEFVDILKRSTLADRRPANDLTCVAGMLEHADLIVTARNELGVIIGVSRAISDFHYCTYLSDLAVDTDYQGQGIGKRLIEKTHAAAGLATHLILLAAPAAQTFYPHIGMESHESCWLIRGKTD